METLENIRVETGIKIGLIKGEEREQVSPSTHALPKIAMVASPDEYITSSGTRVKVEDIDILSRYISMGSLHRAQAVSGAMALAAAANIPGTIPNQVISHTESTVRIGHPSGRLFVDATIEKDGSDWRVNRAANGRTARRLMEGYAYVPISVLQKVKGSLLMKLSGC
ncbi:hypothetical protein HPT25_20970 [Bacillus sp. BRMEA1]|uniref:PrpF domain-containing protein n=1 Tax=Neobacillus endophyticus TaxID=2738405 RepID=UPI001563F97C|nr:PrpF domain-containing protein [Neobacillus endophyticus]NRD79811.1 hypothetical protein [Neobacillus endophyticus]